MNPAAYQVIPISTLSGASITPGNLSRNALRSNAPWDWDLGVAKALPITEHVKFQLQANAFRVTNHPYLESLDTGLTDSNFGHFKNATNRTLQISGRLTF